MRIAICYDVDGWAHHNRALALQKYAPDDFEVDIYSWKRIPKMSRYDLVFSLDYASTRRKKFNTETLVVSFNCDHQRRERYFRRTIREADFVVCNNKACFEHYGRIPNTCCISNGVDTEFWRSYGKDRPDRVLWTGSDNPAKRKGYHDVLLPLKPLLEDAGFEVDYRPINSAQDSQVMTREEMRDWYNSGRYILCASESEATPNTTLEGMACGCIPVTPMVGNALEMHQGVVFANRTPEAFLNGCILARDNKDKLLAESRIGEWSYECRAPLFFDLFRRLINGERVEPFSYDEIGVAA